MRFYKTISGGYILSVGTGDNTGEEITEQQYKEILSMLREPPVAPDGFGYRLTDSLEWELYELSIEEIEETATETDYQNALREMGVEV